MGWPKTKSRLAAASNCRDDANLIAALGRGAKSVHVADVFTVHIYVDEVTNFSVFTANAFFDARVCTLQSVHNSLQVRTVHIYLGLATGYPAQWGRYSYCYCQCVFLKSR